MKSQTAKTKVTCPRCDGSGNYSFNLMYGTVCFRCNGAGFVMVNLKNEARKEAARAKREEASEARRQLNLRVYREVINEMNAIYKIENVETVLGVDRLDHAVYKATGRDLAQIRDERVKAILAQ